MVKLTNSLVTCSAIIFLLSANVAAATTYSNTYANSDICCLGLSQGSDSIGQVFNTSQGLLSDWTFYANGGGTAGNVKLVLANWSGNQAVGPAIYSSSDFSYSGAVQALSFNGINASLAAGTYIAYLTVTGENTLAVISFALGNSDGGLGGGLTFLNSGGVDPLTLITPWHLEGGGLGYNMQFTADITAVPEPEAYAMLLAGLGMIGFTVRRRKNDQA
jgi:hypothetical protein